MSTTHPNPLPHEERTWTDPLTLNTYTVRLCYVDNAGSKWWEFIEPLRMPTARGVDGEFAAEWANLHVTPDDLIAYCEKMREDGNKGQVVSMFATLDNLEARVRAMAERKSLAELAKVYYLIDDEPIEAATVHHNLLKEERWSKDAVCQGFFLRGAFVLTHGFSECSGIDILTYLSARDLIALRTPSVKPPDTEPKPDTPTRGRSFLDNVRRSTRRRT